MAKQTFTTGQVLTAAQMTSLQQTAMGGGSATAKTASYTLVAADAGTTVIMNSASATTITVNTSLFSAGDTVFIQNIGVGISTITAGTATVSTASTLALAQYASGNLYFTAAGTSIFSKADGAAASGSTFAGAAIYGTFQTITNNTFTKLTLTSEYFDTDSYTNADSKFTIPAGKAGYYLVKGQTLNDSTASGTRILAIYKNGTLVGQSEFIAGSLTMELSATFSLAVSDTIEYYVKQNSGGSKNFYTANPEAFFQINYLGA